MRLLLDTHIIVWAASGVGAFEASRGRALDRHPQRAGLGARREGTSFYLTSTGTLMLLKIDRNAAGAVDFEAPIELFQSPMAAPAVVLDRYSVSNDGQRFPFIHPRTSTGAKPPITVVVTWTAHLGRH